MSVIMPIRAVMEMSSWLAAAGGSFVVEIADSGIPFDVLSLPDPDTTAGIMDREIGGLGVYFIRKMTDEVSYRREEGRNILRVVLHTDKDAGP